MRGCSWVQAFARDHLASAAVSLDTLSRSNPHQVAGRHERIAILSLCSTVSVYQGLARLHHCDIHTVPRPGS